MSQSVLECYSRINSQLKMSAPLVIVLCERSLIRNEVTFFFFKDIQFQSISTSNLVRGRAIRTRSFFSFYYRYSKECLRFEENLKVRAHDRLVFIPFLRESIANSEI